MDIEDQMNKGEQVDWTQDQLDQYFMAVTI